MTQERCTIYGFNEAGGPFVQCLLAPHKFGEHAFSPAKLVEAGITGSTIHGVDTTSHPTGHKILDEVIDLAKSMSFPVVASKVDHPSHYGGKDNPHEHVKCAEAWGLVDTPLIGAWLYNASKYICRAGKKSETPAIIDLKKAIWYLERAVERLEKEDKS